jgi:CheY-like chemotaxis protein
MAHILIVEDEKKLAEAYQAILESHDHRIRLAANGAEGLELLQKETPDVILLDMKMPKMGGLEFLRELQQLEPQPKTSVIVFSNQDAEPDIDEAFRLGAKNYILKAWASPQHLAKVVDETLAAK